MIEPLDRGIVSILAPLGIWILISGLDELTSWLRERGSDDSQHGLANGANCCAGTFQGSRDAICCNLRAVRNELSSGGIEIQYDCFDTTTTLCMQRVTENTQFIEHQLIGFRRQYYTDRLCLGDDA